MKRQLAYYDTGESLFRPGESVYINKAFEQASPHLHAHDFIEIAYVISGQGIHRIGDQEYPVSKGSLCIINYDIPHEFRSHADSSHAPLWVCNCIFKPEFIDYSLVNCKDFSSITNHFLFRSFFPEEVDWGVDVHLSDTSSSDIEDIYEKMYKEYQIKEPGYIEVLRSNVIELLIKIFRLYQKKDRLDSGIEAGRRQIIDTVIQYMKTNYAQKLSLEELSMMAFLSRNYFCKLFKDCTGMTVFEYAQKIRIEEACRMLSDTDKKVVDIAAEVGYKDIKYFNTVFKKVTGKTPRDFRKQA
ncbi:MAG TPA: AraC family transcriptional regulator [Clostridiaceae bacterium]|nr:AraC family transcriptional regulator [Clostridiaceae bacterium]